MSDLAGRFARKPHRITELVEESLKQGKVSIGGERQGNRHNRSILEAVKSSRLCYKFFPAREKPEVRVLPGAGAFGFPPAQVTPRGLCTIPVGSRKSDLTAVRAEQATFRPQGYFLLRKLKTVEATPDSVPLNPLLLVLLASKQGSSPCTHYVRIGGYDDFGAEEILEGCDQTLIPGCSSLKEDPLPGVGAVSHHFVQIVLCDRVQHRRKHFLLGVTLLQQKINILFHEHGATV